MAAEIAELGLSVRSDGVVVATKRLREMEGQARKTERASTSLADKAEKMGNKMTGLGRSLSLGVTAPLAAAAAASVKFATDFEDSFADIRKTVDATEKQFAQMSREIRQLAKEVPTPVEELNRLAGVAGQLGVQRENIVAFTKTIAMLGDASDIAGEQAALSLSRFMNVMGTAQGDIDRVGSTIVGLGNNFAAMESEIVDTATSLASFGSQMGLTEAQVLAYATAIAASGGQTEAASTAFQKTASTMQRAVIEMNEDLQLFANIAGVSAQQFADAFRDDASGAILLFLQGLKGISDQGQSTAAVLDELGLADQRLQREFGKLLGNLGQLEDAIGLSSEEWERNTALTEEAQKRYETFASQLGIFWNRVKDVAITFGNDLIPALKSGIESAEGFLETLQSLSPETKRLIALVGALVAALGPLLVILGTLVRSITTLLPLVKKLKFALGPAGLAAAIGVELVLAISEGIASFQRFDDIIEEHRRKVDEATNSVALFSEEWIKQRNAAEGVPTTLAGISDELERVETRMRIFRRQGVQETDGAMRLLIDRQRQLEEAFERLGGSADEASEGVNSASESTITFEESLADLVDVIDAARSRSDLYAQSMIAVAEAVFQAATGMRAFNTESNRSGDGMFPDFGVLDSALESMKDIRAEMEEAAAIEWNFENLIDSFHPLSQAMRRLGDEIDLVNARIEHGGMSNMEGMFVKSAMAANVAFGAMMDGVDRTSKEYKQLELAQQATNIALGIAAILQQGMGDPYTAIPRMIAMAAMVAQLVDGIGGLSGSGGGAQAQQDIQGTGTVLGDPEAKSESIANAVEITADATSELVGINRGMLHALQTLQEGLSGAAGMVARGAGQMDASGVKLDLSALSSFHSSVWDPLGFFGGSAVKDQGIKLLGGAISEMTEGAVGMAFADVKKWNLFSSSKKTVTEELGEEFNNQLNLIFDSMIKTVKSAGEALGIPLDELESRIASFEVAAQEISLKDLSAEEQQAELEAVFSAIFDDFASHVIPFVEQFQKIGEGMGETLVRVATSVQVAQEAIKRLGLSIADDLGPERMAQVSVGLVEAAGGIENFITQMESFVSKFAPEAHKFEIAQSDITRALAQMNIELPDSRQGFWELMQSIDATTEAGQQQIATLLSLTDAADTFYSALEEIEKERQGLLRQIMELEGERDALRKLELEKLDESNRALQERVWRMQDEADLQALLADIQQQTLELLSPAHAEYNRLAQAMANQIAQLQALGASEDEMAQARRLHVLQVEAFAASLRESIVSLTQELFGGGEVDSAFSSTASSVSTSMDNIRDSMIRALEAVQDWLDDSLLSNVSPLTPSQRLGEAQSQFDQAMQAAMSGDVDAIRDLPGLADQLLGEASTFFGTSTSDYQDVFDQVRAAMEQVTGLDVPDQQGPPTYGQMSAVQSNTEASAMTEAEQLVAANDLLQRIAVLSNITGTAPSDIAEELDVPLRDLYDIMGLVPNLTGEALESHFDDLVSDIDDELSKLLDIDAKMQSQIDVLLRIETLLGGEREKNNGAFIPKPPSDPPRTTSTGDIGGALAAIEGRLARIEGLTNEGNQTRAQGLGQVANEQRETRRELSRTQNQRRAMA